MVKNRAKLKKEITNLFMTYPMQFVDSDNDNKLYGAEIEFVEPREVVYKNKNTITREIGSQNIIIAIKYLRRTLIEATKELPEEYNEEQIIKATHQLLNDIITELKASRIIRQIPEKVRKTFRVITNEQYENGKETKTGN